LNRDALQRDFDFTVASGFSRIAFVNGDDSSGSAEAGLRY